MLIFVLGVGIGPNPKSWRPSEVIDELDRRFQLTFSDLSLTKDEVVTVRRLDGRMVKVRRSARFGVDRLTPQVPGHPDLLMDPFQKEREHLANALRSAGWSYVVAMYGNAGKPLRRCSLKRSAAIYASTISTPSDANLETLANQALAKIGNKENFTRDGSTWLINVRPVRLSNRLCLNCHGGMKLSDPVALLAYAVAKHRKAK